MSSRNIKIFAIIAGIVIIVGIAYFSTNMSVTQSQSNENFDPRTVFWRHVHGIGFDPDNKTTLYIATHGDFYQSINGASPIKVDEKRADYMSFVAPPQAGVPLYSSGHPETGGNSGLIKSTDGGRTWEFVSNVIEPPVDFHAMAISKSKPKTIIGFDSDARGLFKTIDGGESWEKLPFPEYITALAISPLDSKLIFSSIF